MADGGEAGPEDLLAVALADGQTWKQAAASANVSESTVRRRMLDPKFRSLIGEYRRQIVEVAVGKAAKRMADAVETVHNLLDSESEWVQLKAAEMILSHGSKLHEQADLVERIRRLESPSADA